MRKIVVDELRRRCDLLIENAEANAIECGMTGSRLQFDLALCVLDYPQENPPDWMDDVYKNPAMSEREYNSDLYDAFLEMLHEEAMLKVNG
jgi:hypothetical protein